FRSKESDESTSGVWYFLAGLELFVFASFFVAVDQTLAFYHYLIFLEVIGLFYLLREGTLFKSYAEPYLNKTVIIYVFLSSIFFQAILGIYQFLTQSTFAFKYLGLAYHNPEDSGVAVIEAASGRFLRAYGGFDHPNIFGGVLVVSLILAAYFLAKKKVLNSNKEIFESIFLFIFYFSSLFALFFTFSRTAWMAYIAGLVAILISFIINKDRWMIGRYLALIFFSAVFLFIIASPYRDLLAVRIKADTRLEQKSINERQMYFAQSETLIKSQPFLGVGVGNYISELNHRDKNKQPAWINQPVHNCFLLIFSENGIFALIFFLGFLIALILKDRRETFSWAIIVALIILMMFDHWLISLPSGILFLFFILGLI
ncbi:MAG: O-antigen ligase family protein, partial [Patescibacteria group bacterium]